MIGDSKGNSERGLVSVVIPTHNGLTNLRQCLNSILKQTRSKIEIIVVDNGSTDQTVAELHARYPAVRVVLNPRNLGFAKAVNQGIAAANGEFVFVLNDDTVLAPGCVGALCRRMDEVPGSGGAEIVGLAPKILFQEFPKIVDAVGTGINPDGTGYNVGVGQLDIGQFDGPQRVFGACFAAAFIRAQAFKNLGLLDEGYFAYYEDIDWCYMANSRGYQFRTCPDAIVYHKHSATVRSLMPYREKYYLLFRNRIRFMLRNYRRGNRIRLLDPLKFHLGHIYATVRTPFSRPPGISLMTITLHLRVLVASLKFLPLLLENIIHRGRRKLADGEIWKISTSQLPNWFVPGTFEDETHSPVISLNVLTATHDLATRTGGGRKLARRHRALQLLNRLVASGMIDLAGPVGGLGEPVNVGNFVMCYLGGRHYVRRPAQSCVVDSFIAKVLVASLALDKRQLKRYLWGRVRLPRQIGIARRARRESSSRTVASELVGFRSVKELRTLFDESIDVLLSACNDLGLYSGRSKRGNSP